MLVFIVADKNVEELQVAAQIAEEEFVAVKSAADNTVGGACLRRVVFGVLIFVCLLECLLVEVGGTEFLWVARAGFLTSTGFAGTGTSIAGIAVGKGDAERVRRCCRRGFVCCCSAFRLRGVLFFGGVDVDDDDEVVSVGFLS